MCIDLEQQEVWSVDNIIPRVVQDVFNRRLISTPIGIRNEEKGRARAED